MYAKISKTARRANGNGGRSLIGTWVDRALQRRALAGLDEGMLRDMGLSGSQRRRECDKPFWKA